MCHPPGVKSEVRTKVHHNVHTRRYLWIVFVCRLIVFFVVNLRMTQENLCRVPDMFCRNLPNEWPQKWGVICPFSWEFLTQLRQVYTWYNIDSSSDVSAQEHMTGRKTDEMQILVYPRYTAWDSGQSIIYISLLLLAVVPIATNRTSDYIEGTALSPCYPYSAYRATHKSNTDNMSWYHCRLCLGVQASRW